MHPAIDTIAVANCVGDPLASCMGREGQCRESPKPEGDHQYRRRPRRFACHSQPPLPPSAIEDRTLSETRPAPPTLLCGTVSGLLSYRRSIVDPALHVSRRWEISMWLRSTLELRLSLGSVRLPRRRHEYALRTSSLF
jgi:hypothetical protein